MNLDWVTRFAWLLLAPAGLAILGALRIFLKRLGLDITDAVLWVVRRKTRRIVSIAVNMRRYCKLALNASGTEYLHVPGVRDTVVKTDDIFVELSMEQTTNVTRMYKSVSILKAGTRIRIVGDPGSGKSSLVKRTFREACRQAARNPRLARLPLIVELKDFHVPDGLDDEVGQANWALDEIKRRITAIEGHRMGDFFDSCVRETGLILLLDGLDEVATVEYLKTSSTIRALSRRLAGLCDKNIVILTMRSQFHQQVRRDFEADFPPALWIQPFTPADMYQFLTSWFRESEDALRQANRVYGDLTDRPTVRDMCSNPLVLAMYVANYQQATAGEIPDTRTSFYREVVHELLVLRRSRQMSNRAARIAQKEKREEIFGRLAFENMLDPSQPPNSLSWQRAIEVVCEVARISNTDVAEDIFRELGKETGLFTEERSRESFRFMHLTFCEYFAAVEAATGREDGWTTIIDAHTTMQARGEGFARSRLLEVVSFAIALLNRSVKHEALDTIFDLDDRELYGRCLLETQAYDHDGWSDYVDREFGYFAATTQGDWDEEWLRRLHLYQTVISDANLVASQLGMTLERSVTLQEVFSRLASSNGTKLVQLFGSYASSEPAAAFRLARACGVDLVRADPFLLIRACEDGAFLALARDLAAESTAHIEDWATIFTEAGLLKGLVANTLAKHPAPEIFRSALARVDRRWRWDAIDPPRSAVTYYSAAISIATANYESSFAARRGEIMKLLPIKPPGFGVSSAALRVVGLAVVAVLLGLYVVILVQASSIQLRLVLTGLVLLVLVACVPPFFALPAAKRAAYIQIVNLPLVPQGRPSAWRRLWLAVGRWAMSIGYSALYHATLVPYRAMWWGSTAEHEPEAADVYRP